MFNVNNPLLVERRIREAKENDPRYKILGKEPKLFGKI